MLKCREFVQETTATASLEALERPRWPVRLHWLICRHCRRYLRQLKAMLGILPHLSGRNAHKSADEPTVAKIWQRIEQDNAGRQ